jgi:hypothetical protein
MLIPMLTMTPCQMLVLTRIDEDDLTKEQASISFRDGVVIDDEITSEEEEELEDYVYAQDDIDKPVEINIHETAMLNFLEHCQDAGTSLDFFDKLVSKLRTHGKKGFDIQKAAKRKSFIEDLWKKIHCPPSLMVEVGSHKVPQFDLLEQ